MSSPYNRGIIDLVCQFCGQQCFVPLTTQAPEEIIYAYLDRGVNLMATCPDGQDLDRSLLGYCWADILSSTWDYAISLREIVERDEKVFGLPEIRMGVSRGQLRSKKLIPLA